MARWESVWEQILSDIHCDAIVINQIMIQSRSNIGIYWNLYMGHLLEVINFPCSGNQTWIAETYIPSKSNIAPSTQQTILSGDFHSQPAMLHRRLRGSSPRRMTPTSMALKTTVLCRARSTWLISAVKRFIVVCYSIPVLQPTAPKLHCIIFSMVQSGTTSAGSRPDFTIVCPRLHLNFDPVSHLRFDSMAWGRKLCRKPGTPWNHGKKRQDFPWFSHGMFP